MSRLRVVLAIDLTYERFTRLRSSSATLPSERLGNVPAQAFGVVDRPAE